MPAALGIVASARTEHYLSPSVGYATSPDNAAFTAPLDMTVTFRVRFVGPFTATGVIFGPWGTTTADQSWMIYTTTAGALQLQFRNPALTAFSQQLLSNTELAALGTGPVYIGARLQGNVSGLQRAAALQSLNAGTTWSEIGTAKVGTAAYTGSCDATTPMGVGRRGVTGADIFQGIVYWAQARTGTDPNAGTIIARFDATEVPQGATSWTDPRGLSWTLSAASAVT